MAHKFYMKGGQAKKVIEMYNEAGMWEEAHQLASRHLDTNEVRTRMVDGPSLMLLFPERPLLMFINQNIQNTLTPIHQRIPTEMGL